MKCIEFLGQGVIIEKIYKEEISEKSLLCFWSFLRIRCIPIGYSNSKIFDSIDAWCKSQELGIKTVRKSKNVHTLIYDKVKVYRWYDPQVTDVPARDVSYPPPTVP